MRDLKREPKELWAVIGPTGNILAAHATREEAEKFAKQSSWHLGGTCTYCHYAVPAEPEQAGKARLLALAEKWDRDATDMRADGDGLNYRGIEQLEECRDELLEVLDARKEDSKAQDRHTIERHARQELWSFIRLNAGRSELQASSVEWLDAFAPELVSGRFADIPAPHTKDPANG